VVQLTATDERSHPPADDPGWGESWTFEFFTGAGVGGYVTLTLWPARRVAWYWAYLLGGEGFGGPVAVLDDDAPFPRRAGSLEMRTEGLWADHTCETPGEHWTVGNEAFALRFDNPDEAIGRQRGERVPLGFDLEWETSTGTSAVSMADGYAVPCAIHGVVLLGPERLTIDGSGWRDHRWGGLTWRTPGVRGRLDDGTWFIGPDDITVVSAERAPVLVDGVPHDRAMATVRTSDGRPGRAWLTNLA
jgi:hypothetical protein